MKIIISKEKLKKELNFAVKAIGRKSTIPVLENVLLVGGENSLVITGTDLDNSVITGCEADVREKGGACVNARTLSKIVNVCADEIELEAEENSFSTFALFIKSGKAVWRLESVQKEQYPVTPALAVSRFSIPFAALQTAIKRTWFATTKNQSRFTLSVVKLIVEKKYLTAVATDGHRLAYSKAFIDSGKNKIDGLIHVETLKLLKALPPAETIEIADTEHHWFFRSNGKTVIARKIHGKFPGHDKFLEMETKYSAKFDTIALYEALRQSMITASSHNTVKWSFEKSVANIESQNHSESFKTQIVCSGNAEGNAVGFNASFLLDFCKLVRSGVCAISFGDVHSMSVFELSEQNKQDFFRYVVMPQRI